MTGFSSLSGLLLIDKPAGLTSHDVVARVRRRGRFSKVGHTGTLDPFATGVLPLCLGRATRLAGLLLLEDKGYDATLRMGVTTDTLDLEGRVLRERPIEPGLDEARIDAVIARFRGPIRQVPPMYSALKVKGRSLHEYAREGVEVERAPREVTIHRIERLELALPDVSIRVHCSKGTYVRVLAQDIGEALEVGAHLVALRRTFTGPFGLERAVTLEEVEARIESGTLEEVVIPPHEMLPGVPLIEVSAKLAPRIEHGNPVLRGQVSELLDALPASGLVQLCHGGQLLAVGEVVADAGAGWGAPVVQPRIVMAER
jgi:tRNA pseudouridine55 synthase